MMAVVIKMWLGVGVRVVVVLIPNVIFIIITTTTTAILIIFFFFFITIESMAAEEVRNSHATSMHPSGTLGTDQKMKTKLNVF